MAGHCFGHSHVEVNFSGRGCGLFARGGSVASATSTPSASSAGPANEDVDIDHDDDHDDDNYDDDASVGNNNDNNDDKTLREANAPLKNKNLHQVQLLAGVVYTIQDYSLGQIVPLLDSSAAAQASFEAVELQTIIFSALCSHVHTSRFSDEYPPIRFCCLCWNLRAQFSRCNLDG
jgi:hypothetical protein